MPEGHTIHRLARDHRALFVGSTVKVTSPQGRFQAEAAQLDGRQIQQVSAHGKHLFYHWTNEQTLHVHLGLYGKFRVHDSPFPPPRGAVRLRVEGPTHAFDLNGPNRCELLGAEKLNTLRARLGQDPLDAQASPDLVWERIGRSRAAIGSLLLNQSVIAGIGNIYRAEVLFLLGIHPEKPGHELTRGIFDRIWDLSVSLMQRGVEENRIVTISPENLTALKENGAKGRRVNIYKETQCPSCEREIRCWDLASRKIYACETCQT